LTAAKVAPPVATGASLTAVMLVPNAKVALENAVLPPLLLTLMLALAWRRDLIDPDAVSNSR
jgi:hypothetical protein